MKSINYNDLFDRLKKYMGANSDADVARGLEITPQAVSSFKKQEKFPGDLLINYCLKHQLSLDWLLTGEGRPKVRRGEGYVSESLTAPYLPGVELAISPDLKIIIDKLVAAYDKIPEDDKDRLYGIISRLYDKTIKATGVIGGEGDGEVIKDQLQEEKEDLQQRKSA